MLVRAEQPNWCWFAIDDSSSCGNQNTQEDTPAENKVDVVPD